MTAALEAVAYLSLAAGAVVLAVFLFSRRD